MPRHIEVLEKISFQRLGAALSDSSLAKYSSEIDSWSKTIQEEVHYLMARRTEEEAEATSRFRNASSLFFRSASAQQKAHVRQRILEYCCQFDYMAPWKRSRKSGNTTLFQKCAHYKSWKGQRYPSTLIYTGKVGAGKSVMLANMVDDLHLHAAGASMALAFFFARHDIPETLKARTVVGSLAQQFLDGVTDFTQVAETFEATSKHEPLERMICLLKSVLKPDFKAFVVIDGLDELNDSEGEEALRHLLTLRNSFQLSLCLSYRQEPTTSLKLKDGLRPFGAKILPIPENTSDIESFITDELRRRVEIQELTIRDPLLLLEIRDALLQGSQGMFLWVALQIESLCTMETDEEIRHALEDLPKDLSETFSRILHRSNKSHSPYQKRILEFITVAQRPLTAEELREALSVTPGETDWTSSRLLNNIYHTLRYCGGLVILDEEELTLHLVHHSLKQYLITEANDPTDKVVDVENAHKRMSDIIITYLHGLEITRRQVAKEVIPELNAERIMTGIIHSARQSLDGASQLALKLLKSKTPLELNMGKSLSQAWNLRHSPENHSFFRDYAHRFWYLHIAWSLPLSTDIGPLFRKLWDHNVFSLIGVSGDLEHLFLKAVSSQSLDVTRFLIEKSDVDVNYKIAPYQETALHIAVRHRFSDIITVLLKSESVNVTAMNRNDQTPLELAAKIGPSSIIMPFVAAGKVDRRPSVLSSLVKLAAKEGDELLLAQLIKFDKESLSHGRLFWDAANEATVRGHVGIVKLLLQYADSRKYENANREREQSQVALKLVKESITKPLLQSGTDDIDAVDRNEWSLICLAVSRGNMSILKMLLDREVTYADRPMALQRFPNGVTPLHLAAATGNGTIMQSILACGSENLRLVDAHGNTPLHLAAEGDWSKLAESPMRADPALSHNYARIPVYSAATLARPRHFEVVQLLINIPTFRLSLDWKNHKGNTALHLAAAFGHHKVVGLLADVLTADPNQKNNDGSTPLHLAARYGHGRVVEVLTKAIGIDLNPTDNCGKTPLQLAIESGHHDIEDQLLYSSYYDKP
jgi:ankyrin repeat protein